jgi:alkanesulfonate monooxygenase SsuD/methylene tetrahydromethanopterin reductase-like flavin-dependent oxidoreductase (luciferase family)
MDIAIGLPSTVPGVDRDSLLEFARRGEARGFSSLATLDRLVYPGYEALVALGAAAAVTERIGLLTDILIVPWRANAQLLAKQAATIDSISRGRLTLGVAVGLREDDYEASGIPFSERGRRFEEMLEEMNRVWAGEERGYAGAIGPPPVQEGGPPLLIGGQVDAAFSRAARFGAGWTMGGGTPDAFREGVAKLRSAWQEGGREGEPRGVALCYFALGEGAREAADHDLHHYYAWLGDELADAIAQSAAVDGDMARQYRDAFADAGADELVYFPTSTDPAQVDLLADAVL